MSATLKIYLAAGWGLYILILSVWIISEKRSPQATIGWLLALAWVPVVGWLIYYFFGPQKLKRKQLIRSDSKQLLNNYRAYWQEQVAKALSLYPKPVQDEHGLEVLEEDPYNQLVGLADHISIPHVLGRDARRMSLMIYNMTGLPVSIVQKFELLEDGDQTFEAICKAIQNAQHTVHLEYYIYEPDTCGTQLRDLLTEKVRAGVKVRLLVDWLGSRKVTRAYMADFLTAGGELAFFHEGIARHMQPVLNMRSHRKIVVCDGVVGFTGGINITDEEVLSLHPQAYHDLHLHIEGPAVYWLEHVFLEDWHYCTQEIPQDLQPPMPLESVPAQEVQQMQVVASGPDTPDAPLWRAKLMAINMAKERVWLATPYFAPDESALTALTSAALRGLDVRLMVPHKSDHLITTLATRSWYAELLKAGVRIWEYMPRMLHSKTLLVDEQFSFVGTDNFDNRSFRLNFEVAVLNYERSGALLLAQQFEKDMSSAQEIRMVDRMSVSRLQRFLEDLARLLSPLL